MFINAALILASAYVANHWLGAVCTAALMILWRIIPKTEGPPVLALAMTTQWVQVTAGVYYVGFTGRSLEAIEKSEWEPMVLIGLGAVLALAAGLSWGVRVMASRYPPPTDAPEEVATFKTLLVVYAVSVAMTGAMQELAWRLPILTQAILALSGIRLALFYVVMRRLLSPRLQWPLAGLLIAFEVGLGFTGFFSSFKEPMLLAGLALLEAFNPRRRDHWVFGGTLGVALTIAVVMWMGVRSEYRGAFEDDVFASTRSVRMERMQALTSVWFAQSESDSVMGDVDALVDRAWAIYYPALAVARVPDVIPHTDGEILTTALIHVFTPRILFPDKPNLPNESEHVRKYSGIWVAGEEMGTSIAFGYMAESYVDFGVPLMFLPSLVFGALMGAAYIWLLRNIQHRELAIALVTCVFWLNLYTIERSWARQLGLTLTMMAYLGGTVFLVDRWLLMREQTQADLDASTRDPAFGRR
jgi:hypothetical protein